MAKFQIFTDSCSDLPKEVREKYHIEHAHMNIVVDGEENIADLDWVKYSPEELYSWMKEGKKMKTTAVPVTEFIKVFRPFLEKGIDILYIACSTKLTASLGACELAKQELLEEFPDRKIVGVDSLKATCSEGQLVVDVAIMQEKGATLEECADYVLKARNNYNTFCTTETLTYLKNAGRVKAGKAFMGNLLHKRPIIVSGKDGNNVSITTVTGTKNADKLLFDKIVSVADDSHEKVVFLGQGDAKERAAALKTKFEEAGFEVIEHWIGPIIGISCGPGVLIAGCYGKPVVATEDNPVFQD